MKSYTLMPVVALLIWWCAILAGVRAEEGPDHQLLVKREERKTLFSSEDGHISAARVADATNNASSYLLHFFTLEPNSLFLPALLHAHMLFYVHTGSGKLSWTDEGELKSTEIRRGDVFRLEQGSFFFVHSNLETERQKLRIHAIFVDSNNDSHEPATGPYSSIRDMVLGFDRQVLKAAFKVPEEVIDDLMNGTSPISAIVHGLPRTKKAAAFEMEALFMSNFLGTRSYNVLEKNKKKKKSGAKSFNLFKADKDFENCNGWSTAVTGKKLSALKGSNVGLFMVNLTAGSMMGPHWNPAATEIAVVLQGRGVVRVVCSTSSPNETRCRNTRFEVGEGDVFVVPRFHPMAQMSFNNDTLVFMGFSTSATANHPQYLAGQASVLRTLDRDVLAMSFNITNTTLDRLLTPQHESVILGCVSCADEELRTMEEERERTRKEAMEKEEEETRRREEEKKREEEEAEAAAKREEEERRTEEAARKREEEAAKREEEERRRKEEEEEAEARRKEEEEAARKREEETAKREEEERRRKEEEEEAEARRKEEEEAARKREEGAAKREEEERMRKEEEEEAEARREKEEESEREKEKGREEEARQREEEAARKEEEERRRKEGEEEAEATRKEDEEAARQPEEEEEEARQGEEERARREEEEQEEETQRRRQEEEARKREEEKAKQREEDTRQEEQEQERQRQEEQEATQKHQEQEEARHREEQHGEGRKSEGERAAEEERIREEEAQREEKERGGGQDGEKQRWGGKILKKRLSV